MSPRLCPASISLLLLLGGVGALVGCAREPASERDRTATRGAATEPARAGDDPVVGPTDGAPAAAETAAEHPDPSPRSVPGRPVADPVADPDPDPLAGVTQGVDESLRRPEDPAEWLPLASYAGRPVEVLRELDPEGTRLMRIYTALADAPEASLPVPHGPDWRFFDNGLPARAEHWLQGVPHGPLRTWWRTGRPREEGAFDQGTRVGTWRRWGRMGQLVFEGAYDEGRPAGPHREWFADGQLQDEAAYRGGQLHGRHRTWGRDGTLVLDENWEDGVRQGRWSDFYPSTGQPRTWGDLERDLRVGVWRVGREDGGGLLLQETYAAGRKQGVARRWSPTGQLVAEEHWEDDEKTGPVRTWYPDGGRQSEGRLEAGRREGEWTYWSPDGSINGRWTGTYEDDRLVQ